MRSFLYNLSGAYLQPQKDMKIDHLDILNFMEKDLPSVCQRANRKVFTIFSFFDIVDYLITSH